MVGMNHTKWEYADAELKRRESAATNQLTAPSK